MKEDIKTYRICQFTSDKILKEMLARTRRTGVMNDATKEELTHIFSQMPVWALRFILFLSSNRAHPRVRELAKETIKGG